MTYWKEMVIVLEKRAVWKEANEWLVKWAKSGDCLQEADHVRQAMSDLDWSSDITSLGAFCPKQNLARLLSDNWIDDELMNMATNELAARVHLDPVRSKTTLVAPLSLQHGIENAHRTGDYTRSGGVALHRYSEIFKAGMREELYFATHVNNNHWVPMHINFNTRRLRYGQHFYYPTQYNDTNCKTRGFPLA